jgi:hypothetical protein
MPSLRRRRMPPAATNVEGQIAYHWLRSPVA